MKPSVLLCCVVLLTIEIMVQGQTSNTRFGQDALAAVTSGANNTAVGYQSLRQNRVSHDNSAFGASSLQNLRTGGQNTAFGYYAMGLFDNGFYNTAIGTNVMQAISGSCNTAVGDQALRMAQGNLSYITAIGYNALFNNKASNVTAVGVMSLFNNSTGTNNTALGTRTLLYNSTGSGNTAIGDSAGARFNSNNSTFIGYQSGASATGFQNSTAIGYQTVVTGSNQVRLGNAAVTSIGGRVAWSTISDGRFKMDIREDVPGLSFIKLLKPVTYVIDAQKLNSFLGIFGSGETHGSLVARRSGFIAQDVARAAANIGYEFGGIDAPQSSADHYSLRYAEFVVPLVKAVQELNMEIEELKSLTSAIEAQQKEIDGLYDRLTRIQENGNKGWIKQNAPNPAANSTVIEYAIPTNVKTSWLLITNAKGQQISMNKISGSGQITISTTDFPSGTYQYSLVCDGKTISTRKIVIAH